MSSAFNARKALARLEVRSLTLADMRPRSALVCTSPDAAMRSPPATKQWRRIERAIAMLRKSLWNGASRIHSGYSHRHVADPDATTNIDIAAALGMAARSGDGKQRMGASLRALALMVYLYRNWPSYAERNHLRVLDLAFEYAKRIAANRNIKHGRKTEILLKIAEICLEELVNPPHCTACGGYGKEQTGVRVGQSCQACGGMGIVERSSNARARSVRVRRADWGSTWGPVYLALYDKLKELEERGASLHTAVMDE